jgi:hypothetical protein
MADFHQSIQQHRDVSEELQKRVGQSSPAKMDEQCQSFLDRILALIEKKEIDLLHPQSFLNQDKYGALPEVERDQVDLALINIANLLTHIVEFRISRHTPDESPELESMISHLLQMLERLGQHRSVFKL